MSNNKIILIDGKSEKEVSEVKGIKIKFRGDHNIIKVYNDTHFEGCEFNMDSNCVIEIGKTTNTLKK